MTGGVASGLKAQGVRLGVLGILGVLLGIPGVRLGVLGVVGVPRDRATVGALP